MTSKTPVPSDHPNLIPTEQEFEAWAANPVTRWVALSHKITAEKCKARWVRITWDDGDALADQTVLGVLKARSESLAAIYEASWRDHLRAVNPDAWEALQKGDLTADLEPVKQRERSLGLIRKGPRPRSSLGY